MSSPQLPHTILAADWGGSPGKRRAVCVHMESLTVRGVAPLDGATLSGLMKLSPFAGTLVAVDAVVGIPRYIGDACRAANFVDWLRQASTGGQLFEPATRPEDWSPTR